MKQVLKNSLAIILAMLVALPQYATSKTPTPGKAGDTLLIGRKWTLVEIVKKTDATVTDVTSLMLPCEMDNYLEYSRDGKYRIFEGETKCNSRDSSIIVEGSWTYEPGDTSLALRYGSGAKIFNKILSLTEEELIVQYHGENNSIVTLTYLSETGIRNNAGNETQLEGNNAAQLVISTIRRTLDTSHYYQLLNKKEFYRRFHLTGQQQKNARKKVALLPLITAGSQGDTIAMKELNKALKEQAQKTGADYVVTGKLLEAASREKKKQYIGQVKFIIAVYDVKADLVDTMQFEGDNNSFWEKVGRTARPLIKPMVTALGVAAIVVLGYSAGFSTLYTMAALNNATTQTYGGGLSGKVKTADRQKNFDSTVAILKSVEKTTDDVQDYVEEKVAYHITIKETIGTGKKVTLLINAGKDISLEKGDVLKVMKATNRASSKESAPKYEMLGKIIVEEMIGTSEARCQAKGKADDIVEAFNKTPADLFVLTSFSEKNNR